MTRAALSSYQRKKQWAAIWGGVGGGCGGKNFFVKNGCNCTHLLSSSLSEFLCVFF